MADYEHVLEARRNLVDADEETRICAVQEDVWINYPIADHVLRVVGGLLKAPIKIQAECLLVSGAPGMGKSALFQRINKRYGLNSEASSRMACYSMLDGGAGSYKSFAEHIVRALTGGHYDNPSLPDPVLLNSVRGLGIKGIAIDELNEMLLCPSRDVRKCLSLLKKISGAPFSIPVVALGTEECESVMAFEKQMARRFQRTQLPPWNESEHFRSFLASYESTLPLKHPSNLASESIVKFLVQASEGVLDNMVKIISHAAILAILERKERISMDLLSRGLVRPVC
ncbi:TniB family NTP-binding protein [Pseudomonas panipatensis]|uniref:TniB protein n=1 Tax=Pseudomonas panipatensis TaxID=428992 RepID=A0A1G8L8N3_9PSED|nr:TniB family NTP-binding protein [Pseudomonas panipatensis]SDI51991.1 TniB protein [Pseudomonas panipatensis]SMP75417.1 TniB protein [Pseudomonas panipatensis]